MFIRPCYRQKNGKRHGYWALVESYRTCRGPRQRVISYLGQMEESGRWGMQQKASSDETFNKWMLARTPMNRWGEPEELVGAAVFLSSEASSFVTGQIVYVDGGILALL
jgi:NAD(P)-dependent dehydrogenase (short-subunit alcohol dehydrogenase family)